MIFLSGSINTVSLENQQREVEVYQKNGWTLKDPTTHDVRIVIEDKDMEEFIKYLRSLPVDKKARTWTDRNGKEHTSETVSFRLKGTEMSGSWIKLRAALKTDQDLASPAHQHGGMAQAPQRNNAAGTAPSRAAAQMPVSSPAAQWQPSPQVAEAVSNFDEDIPF